MSRHIPLANPPWRKLAVLQYASPELFTDELVDRRAIFDPIAWKEARWICSDGHITPEGLTLLNYAEYTESDPNWGIMKWIFNVPHFYDRLKNRGVQRRLPKRPL